MIQRLQHRDEQGATLILALAFLSLFGVFIAAILAQVSTNMRLTSTTRARTDRLLAADGGLEWGIQRARTQDTTCTSVAAGLQTLTSALTPLIVDGRTLTVKCQAMAGAVASPASQQWSVITNGLTTLAGASPVIAGGDVWAGGTVSAASTVATTDADVIRGVADCTAFALTGLTVGAPDISSCTTAAEPDVPHTLPPAPPIRTDAAVVSCGGNNWSIWHPGTYKGGAGPDVYPYNYLESGVYYFEDISLNLPVAAFIGGKPPAGETSVLNAECAGINDATLGAASQASGAGVTIILGGASGIRASGTKFELYTRAPATPAGTPGISVTTVPSDNAVPGYKPWSPPVAVPPSAVHVTGRAAIHGLVYARNAPVSLTTNLTAPLLGGLVASTLTIVPGAAGLKAVEANGRRTLLLTSTAAPGSSGEVAAAQSAVVKIANDPARTASVRSWRAQ